MGILWHKSIGATPIADIASDRICGIRFPYMNGGDTFSVVGVYLSCLDQALECYREYMYLVELEWVISESMLLGPVAVLGDFNAHFGDPNTHRGASVLNIQGMLLQEVMDRCNLTAVSLGCLSSGPKYMYCSGGAHTTVDYILADVAATSLMSSCLVHTSHDLNTSDHLPLTVSIKYSSQSSSPSSNNMIQPKVDWDQARKSGMLVNYMDAVYAELTPLLSNVYI